jgi:hypothetical protein
MSQRKIQVGTDANGNFAVELRFHKDDPIKPYILALAEQAAQRVTDSVTGFTYEKSPQGGTPLEMQEFLMRLLPEDLQQKFAEEGAAVKQDAVDSLLSSDLSGMLGLLSGNFFQQQAALQKNSVLANFSGIAGSMKPEIDRLLGGSVFGEHVKSEIQAGAFDAALKSGQE